MTKAITLNKAEPGLPMEVICVGGSLEGFIHRLEALGFHTGATVTVTLNQWPFPLLLQVGDADLTLSRRDARRISVKP